MVSQQFLLVGVLQEIGLRAGPHRFEHGFIVVERGQHQHLAGGQIPGDLPRGGDSSFDGHVQVHQDDVGTKSLGKFNGLRAIARLADDLHVGFHGQQHRRAPSDERLILGDHDPDRSLFDGLTQSHNHLHRAAKRAFAIMRSPRPVLEVTLVTPCGKPA